jgi:DNA-binding transcriptional ArsR family regulator
MDDASRIAGSEDAAAASDTDWVPDPERLVSDVETLRALSDPLRLRILEAMVRRMEPAWSVKELAAVLEVPATRLYHHIELLLDRELIRPAGRRVVSGIIETRYRVASMSLRLDRALFAGESEEARAVFHDVLVTLFESSREEIEASIRSGRIEAGDKAPPERRLLALKGAARLTPARAAELQARLAALIREFEDDSGTDPDATGFGLVVAVYPLPDPAGAASGTSRPMEPTDD